MQLLNTLEKEMATHSSILAWRIPQTEEPGGLQSMGSQRVGHNWVTNTFTFIDTNVHILIKISQWPLNRDYHSHVVIAKRLAGLPKFPELVVKLEFTQVWNEVKVARSHLSDFLRPHGLQSPWNSPEYCTAELFPSPGNGPSPGIEPRSPTLQVDS